MKQEKMMIVVFDNDGAVDDVGDNDYCNDKIIQ